MHEKLFAKSGLSLERLKSFSEIIEARGITSAAQSDPTKQSQFSRQLKELEEFFGSELLKRRRGRCDLTPAGKSLYEIARSHFNALEDLRRTCADEPVELSLAAGESLLQWIILPRLAKVQTTLRNSVFVLQNLQTEEILARLADGRTDLGILRKDAAGKSLETFRLPPLKFSLFVPHEMKTSAHLTRSCRLLEKIPLVVLEGNSRLNNILEQTAKRSGIQLNIRLRCSSYTQAAEAVKTLRLAAILPTAARVVLPPDATSQIALPFLASLTRPLVLAWNRKQAAIRPVIENCGHALSGILSGSQS